ncbi:ATP-dependent helicase [filamentous cyanobacterium CCT1]|nr:ATP-dependent helicase [filamentous cyanobacterium CCT1]PSN80907.1 ATP-dependent helicase [filamentous cyanobacterium CCP4]
MVETELTLEPEVLNILEHIKNGNNFLLSGGAGSGKTYSLVEVIKQVILENPTSQIACMTYTNAAVKEIERRVNNKSLRVSTIHDFLWDSIKSYQRELKRVLVELANDESIKEIKSPDGVIDFDYFIGKEIRYKEYTLIREGIISHGELLVLANHMYATYSKLCDILKSKFKFIFIDEYQDTSPLIIEIVLDHLKKSNRRNTIGFFGDSMQSIYDDGVGDLNKYVSSGYVQEVKKEQNRRNPRLVYELSNKLRTDGLVQKSSADNTAPNMRNGVVKEGCIRFYYSKFEDKLDALKKDELNWNFADSNKTKELNLTHNLIAEKAGFENLMAVYDGDKILDYRNRIKKYIKDNNICEDFSTFTFGEVIEKLLDGKFANAQRKSILPTDAMQRFIDLNHSLYEEAKKHPYDEFKRIYVDKDALLDDKKENEEDESKTNSKRDNLIKHLFKIQVNVSLYREKRFNEFLRKTEFKIKTSKDKEHLKEVIDRLQELSSATIEEVIEYASEEGICKKDDKLLDFIRSNNYIYNRVKEISFQEFQNLFDYLEGRTPFSTQHKIKGSEFDNVLVVLDNGNWSKYNFQYLFEGGGTASVLERTRKLFYVCCTRAKENLVVYYHNPSDIALEKAQDWFGVDNVFCI